ncbi:MAG: prepilin-type N-terminal cleavage/methylation domain-containing protein [Candidatus Saccharibacteria bacterium]|nr:prepilin-type N-terminal cleavage/methylation domain-containing protein [Candidatus Saccharibacteria bacterium]
MRNHKHRGFTIVEIIVAIVVIAILATITIVSYGWITKDAQDTAAFTKALEFKKALDRYVTKYGSLPRVNIDG